MDVGDDVAVDRGKVFICFFGAVGGTTRRVRLVIFCKLGNVSIIRLEAFLCVLNKIRLRATQKTIKKNKNSR